MDRLGRVRQANGRVAIRQENAGSVFLLHPDDNRAGREASNAPRAIDGLRNRECIVLKWLCERDFIRRSVF